MSKVNYTLGLLNTN